MPVNPNDAFFQRLSQAITAGRSTASSRGARPGVSPPPASGPAGGIRMASSPEARSGYYPSAPPTRQASPPLTVGRDGNPGNRPGVDRPRRNPPRVSPDGRILPNRPPGTGPNAQPGTGQGTGGPFQPPGTDGTVIPTGPFAGGVVANEPAFPGVVGADIPPSLHNSGNPFAPFVPQVGAGPNLPPDLLAFFQSPLFQQLLQQFLPPSLGGGG